MKLLMIGETLGRDAEVEQVVVREGFDVLRANDGETGLATLRSAQPAVVMFDHDLGERDGVELLKHVRAEDPTCETILVTDGGVMEAAIEVLRAGAVDYLRRPIDPEQLRLALGRARERREQGATIPAPTILVLEDHQQTLERLVNVLQKEGYRVESATDGERGMQLLAEKRIDLVLADVRMPNKDGLSVLRETKQRTGDVEFIVVTGYGDEDVVVQALRDGAINFLRKPIDIDQMLLAIEKALDFQTTRRSLAYRKRDIELMQQLVLRLTRELELVVEAPTELTVGAVTFLRELIDALPFGIAAIGPDRRVLFANHHITAKMENEPAELSADWVSSLGLSGLDEAALDAAFVGALEAKPGKVEALALSEWSFLLMTPLKVVRDGVAERVVALVIRGERRQ